METLTVLVLSFRLVGCGETFLDSSSLGIFEEKFILVFIFLNRVQTVPGVPSQ